MKHRSRKKINRGLVLGGILLVALIVFIVVKETQFRKEKPMIRQVASEYVTELLAVNLATQEAEPEIALTEAQKAAQKDALEEVIRKYWYMGESDIQYGNVTADDMRAVLPDYQNSPMRSTFENIYCQVPESAISVRADGPDRAIVSININNLNTEFRGGDGSLFPSGSGFRLYSSYGKGFDMDPDIVYEPAEDPDESPIRYTGSYYGYITLEMERVKGTWKIVSQDWMLDISGAMPIEEVEK